MPKTMFKKQLLASSVAMVVASGVSAQTNQAIQEEELVVTGIRASLTRAMDMKRDAQGVVDAINAEDIGKFPDTNLAESLQRISGVSIDRVNGEGSRITVRGLGPDFNLVTLNGRQMPGASIQDTSVSGSRSFDFANIASEGVSAVEVFKTVRASNPSGGIGATVNIKTARPFDKPGMNASFGAKAVYDESSDEGGFTPELSALYSNTFLDDTFGVGLSASYQNRQGGSANASNGGGWFYHRGNSGGGGVDINDPLTHRNPPAANEIYAVPQQLTYAFTEFERTRINGQLVLQWAPVESVEMTLDYTYSENEVDSSYHDIGAWFDSAQTSHTVWSENGNLVQTPYVYMVDHTPGRDLRDGYDPLDTAGNSATGRGGDLAFGTGITNTVAENNSVGFNIKWEASDRLTLSLDAHHSEAEMGPSPDSLGNSVGITVASYSRNSTTAFFDTPFPVFSVDNVNSRGESDVLAEDLFVTGSVFRRSEMTSEIDQVQFDGDFEISDAMSVNFGAAHTAVSNVSSYDGVQRNTWSGLGEPGWITNDMFTLETVRDKFDAAPADQRMVNQMVAFDFNKLRNFAIANYSDFDVSPDDAPVNSSCGHYYCGPESLNNNFITDETSVSAYIQFNWETEIGTMPFNLSAGVRHEETEVESPATVQGYSGLQWTDNNEMNLILEGDPVLTNQTGKYTYDLPSLDMDLEVYENVKLRASYGQSLARPNYNDIQGGETYAQNPRPGGTGGTGSRGNPGLLPYVSDNFDFSVEWYYSDASYLSAGYFQKDVKNYIGSTVESDQTPLDIARDPSRGPRADMAIAADPSINGYGDYAAIRQWILDNAATLEGVEGNIIYGLPEDPRMEFDITVPVNDKKATIDGFEFNIQHIFGESGFGAVFNYTMVDSDTEYNNNLLGQPQFVVTGLSDTKNIVGFYEKDGLQVRLSYNWRDDFINSTGAAGRADPGYTDEYEQFDLNASYEFSDQLTVFVEGINLTDEYTRTYSRDYYQTLGVFDSGPRYNIGARYTF